MGRVAEMGCMACGAPACVHHVHSDGMKRITRSHRRVVGLCDWHHQNGPDAVHKIGHARFTELFGIDLLQVADRLWENRDG